MIWALIGTAVVAIGVAAAWGYGLGVRRERARWTRRQRIETALHGAPAPPPTRGIRLRTIRLSR